MHLGKKLCRILLGTILVAACADGAQLTGPNRKAPGGAAFDGIGSAGSGNRTGSTSSAPSQATSGGWTGSGSVTQTDSTTTAGAAGGGWVGSGN